MADIIKTTKSMIVDVIVKIEEWIPMFEQGNAPAVLTDVMELLDSQQAEIERLKAEKETIIKKLKYMIETRSRVLENKSDLMDLTHYKGQSYADRRDGKVIGLMLALEIAEGKDGIALDKALKDGGQE